MLRLTDLSCTIPDEKVSLMDHFCFLSKALAAIYNHIHFKSELQVYKCNLFSCLSLTVIIISLWQVATTLQ